MLLILLSKKQGIQWIWLAVPNFQWQAVVDVEVNLYSSYYLFEDELCFVVAFVTNM